LLVLLILYMVLCMLVYIFQQNFILHPLKGSQPPPEDLQIKEQWIPSGEGIKLHAWWMPVDSAEYTVLFFHGNAGNISHSDNRMRLFHRMGFNALAVDYRGFGISEGKVKKENDLYEDAKSSYDYLINHLGIPENKIIIWGWSLGGGVAVDLAQNKKCHCLVMESTFYCMMDMAKRTFGFLPLKWLLKYKFLSSEKLANINCPVLFIHSREDRTVPFYEGIKLYEKFSGSKKFVEISGDHNHGLVDSQEKFIPQALPFLKK